MSKGTVQWYFCHIEICCIITGDFVFFGLEKNEYKPSLLTVGTQSEAPVSHIPDVTTSESDPHVLKMQFLLQLNHWCSFCPLPLITIVLIAWCWRSCVFCSDYTLHKISRPWNLQFAHSTCVVVSRVRCIFIELLLISCTGLSPEGSRGQTAVQQHVWSESGH